MRVRSAGSPHLSYSTNIHPGETWAQIRANLGRYLPAIKARVAPDRPFGVGLRLGARAAAELTSHEAIAELHAFLAAQDLYVFTINGFPYGAFHGLPVKEAVYRPDWREEARVAYTARLGAILDALLPEGVDGSVSTVPGAYRRDVCSPADRRLVARNIARAAAALVRTARGSGRNVALALEPEPSCMIETVAEAVTFYREYLLAPETLSLLGEIAGLGDRCEEAMRRHVGVCLDACHSAVELEDPGEAVKTLRAAGILVAKVQVSAGLRIDRVDDSAMETLEAFAEPTYLHQVVERAPSGAVTRFTDLPEALAALRAAAPDLPPEWRVHFHVPVFVESFARLASTRPFLAALLAIQRDEPISQHLEVETYTFDVLPPEHHSGDVVSAVSRELEWVIGALEG